jgi:hypothetical protein
MVPYSVLPYPPEVKVKTVFADERSPGVPCNF